jgi:hypothetical protein
MGRRIIVVTTLVGAMLGATSAPAFADQVPPSPDFGQHLAEITPEHPQEDGAMFGACVSTMALGSECPHR